MNAIVVNEERKTIDKFRDWYQQTFIETEVSQKIEKYFDNKRKMGNKVTEIVGKVAPPIVAMIPEVSFLAPLIPVLSKVGQTANIIEESIAIGLKRFVEEKVIGVDGSSKEVGIPNIDFAGFGNDVADSIKGISNGISQNNNKDTDFIVADESVGKKR